MRSLEDSPLVFLIAALAAGTSTLGCSGATSDPDVADGGATEAADDGADDGDAPGDGGNDGGGSADGGDGDGNGDNDDDDDDDADDGPDDDDNDDTAGGAAGSFFEDFSDLQGAYATGETFGAWTVIAAFDQAVVVAARDAGIAAHSGTNVFHFSGFASSPGFGDNRIDRCVELDASLSLTFDYHVYAITPTVDDDMRVRVNPNFYADLQTCEADVAADITDNRLDGDAGNLDWDVRLFSAGVQAGEWFHATESTDGEVGPQTYAPESYPDGTTVVRFSLRARDDGFVLDDTRRIYIDSVSLAQE